VGRQAIAKRDDANILKILAATKKVDINEVSFLLRWGGALKEKQYGGSDMRAPPLL